MGFFRRRRPEPKQDGRTAETAFQMPAVGSGSAVAIEYKTLGKLFGVEGQDWRIHDRIRSTTASGREIEKFIVGTRKGREVVYFDITDVLTASDPPEISAIIEGALNRQKNRFVTIKLPKTHLILLFTVMVDVRDQLSGDDFDNAQLVEKLASILNECDLESGDAIDVTLSVHDFIFIMSVTGQVKIDSAVAEEYLSDVRGYIEKALDGIGPGD